MDGQVIFIRIMWLLTAAIVLYLVVHSAVGAFTQSAGVLTAGLQ
jgi:hypothetical protein